MHIYDKALRAEALTKIEIQSLLQTLQTPEGGYHPEKLTELFEVAHRITRKFMGSKFDSCSIINAKSGNCSEDCKWCSQSAHNKCTVDIYPLISPQEAVVQAAYNRKQGIKRFSLVTSGKRVSKNEVEQVCEIIKQLPKDVIPCVSLGLVDREDLQKLYDAGVTRYHCNIETAPGYFKNLCTTHTVADKMETLHAAREVGMSLCSGGIIGMGETLEDRVDMALYLRNNQILSIPINLLHPIPGTPLENASRMSDEEFLLSISLFRIINPHAYLRFAGGRALVSKELQKNALYVGINSAIMGDMLTTLGSGANEDIQMFTEAGYDFFGDGNNEMEGHIWHPYSSVTNPGPLYFAEQAEGVKITIQTPDGIQKELIDGMSSWWSAIHGYNHPDLNRAVSEQLSKMSHVMFGGFTHAPVRELTRQLLQLLPDTSLSKVFYADSGSVSVEVALKMALQYWIAQGIKGKEKFATIRGGYHGDTWNAMSVCDPETGMHSIFGSALPIHFFVPIPTTRFRRKGFGYQHDPLTPQQEEQLVLQEQAALQTDIAALEELFRTHASQIAGFILEPVVQGAGGMRFYSPEYLAKVKELCTKYNVLLILDEIATGFGRTGKMFAMEHTAPYTGTGKCIVPDILTVGKGLTGGYMTLAATICTHQVAETICNGYPGVFMHGPTFMGNPLACAVASASLKLLQKTDPQLIRIRHIETQLTRLLAPARELQCVQEVRTLGAIGVIELKEAAQLNEIQPLLVEHGIWLRPFGKLVYTMPPYIISDNDLETLCRQTINVLKQYRG